MLKIRRKRKLKSLAERIADSRRRSELALLRKCPQCDKLMRSHNGNAFSYYCDKC